MITGPLCIRTLRSLTHEHKDRTPEQEKRLHPDTIKQKPGQWKSFTNLKYFREQRKVVDDFDAEKLDAYLSQMNLSLETENDMVRLHARLLVLECMMSVAVIIA